MCPSKDQAEGPSKRQGVPPATPNANADLTLPRLSWTSDRFADVIDSVSSETGVAEKVLLELDDPTHPADPDYGAPIPVQRPTVIPKFDPLQYAEASEFRERMPTFTDDAALEQARLQSFPTNAPPPPRRPLSTLPGPRSNPPDSFVEADVGEDEIESLPPDDQVVILRAHLMPITRVPELARPLSELGDALADPKAAYVLGFVDGILPLETIIDVTGLPELETLRVLDRLINQGLVVFSVTYSRR